MVTTNKELKIEGQPDSVIDHEAYTIPNEMESDNASHLKFEVNWIDSVKPFKKIRLTDVKTGAQYVIDKEQLMTLMFILSDEEDQEKFVTETMQNNLIMERYFDVKLSKDYHKGETVTVRLPIKAQLDEFTRRPIKVDPKAKDSIVIKR